MEFISLKKRIALDWGRLLAFTVLTSLCRISNVSVSGGKVGIVSRLFSNNRLLDPLCPILCGAISSSEVGSSMW